MVENSARSMLALSHILELAVYWDETSLDGLPRSHNKRIARPMVFTILLPKERSAAGVYVRKIYIVGKVTQTPNTKVV